MLFRPSQRRIEVPHISNENRVALYGKSHFLCQCFLQISCRNCYLVLLAQTVLPMVDSRFIILTLDLKFLLGLRTVHIFKLVLISTIQSNFYNGYEGRKQYCFSVRTAMGSDSCVNNIVSFLALSRRARVMNCRSIFQVFVLLCNINVKTQVFNYITMCEFS